MVATTDRTVFSVIVPVFNRRQQLAACIASLRAQEYRDFELIVVDDGSTDGSCDDLAGATDVTVLTKPNGGPAAARNFGAAQAGGSYLFFLDSDDLSFPWTLASYAAALASADRPAIICGNFIEFSDTPPAVERAPPVLVSHRDYLAAALGGLYPLGGMIAIRRDLYIAAGGFDAGMTVSEDHDLMLRLGEAPGLVHIVTPPTYAKRDHVGSISKSLPLLNAGVTALLAHFREGRYGSSKRARDITGGMVAMHLRAAVFNLAYHGFPKRARMLYGQSFGLNLRKGRIKFLIAGPAAILRAQLRKPAR